MRSSSCHPYQAGSTACLPASPRLSTAHCPPLAPFAAAKHAAADVRHRAEEVAESAKEQAAYAAEAAKEYAGAAKDKVGGCNTWAGCIAVAGTRHNHR